MNYKSKRITINLLIIFLSVILLGQVTFLFVSSILNRDSGIDISVEATGHMSVIKKTGLLDLVGEGITINLSDQVSIKDKETFSEVFNGYFEKLKQEGGYSVISEGILSGTALSMTAYQAFIQTYEVDAEGNVFIENITSEVPSASGSTTGYGEIFGKRIWVDSESQKIQETHNVSYTKEGNRYILNATYETAPVNQKKNRELTLLPFVVTASTITSFSIKENAMSYDIELSLNESGYAHSKR